MQLLNSPTPRVYAFIEAKLHRIGRCCCQQRRSLSVALAFAWMINEMQARRVTQFDKPEITFHTLTAWKDGWKDGRVEKGSELRRSQKCIGCALIKKRRRCKIREKRCCRSEKGQVAATATACHASPHSQSPIDTGKNSRFLPEALSIAIPFLLSRARECRSLRLQFAMGMQEFSLNLHSIYFALFCH